MKTFTKSTLSMAVALASLLALLLVSPQSARGQAIVNQPGTAFIFPIPQQMELGPVLDVVPVVLSDGVTINLTLIPTLSEFVGYDNPNEVLTGGFQLPVGSALLPTVLPRFRVRQVTTTVNVWDGQTVVLGGLMSESVVSIKDKVPVLGDLPFFGALFRSESRTASKRNLMIFVTPTLIDPAGNRLHTDEDMPFAANAIPVQPPPKTPLAPAPQ